MVGIQSVAYPGFIFKGGGRELQGRPRGEGEI